MRFLGYKVFGSSVFEAMKTMGQKSLLLIAMLGAATLTSCIDEYNELPEGVESTHILVVNGQIEANSYCIFTLNHTVGFDEPGYLTHNFVPDARIAIVGSNGDRFEGFEYNAERSQYCVHTGNLAPDVQYSLHIEAPGYGTFASTPMTPLDAPAIAELSYEKPRPDDVVDFLITTEDPGGPTYLLWEYYEYWEIYTPFIAYWEYRFTKEPDPNDKKNYEGSYIPVPAASYTNHGWCQRLNNASIIADNKDYGNGAFQKLCLYQRHKDNVRFQTRYYTRVRQIAITLQEYEYRHMMQTQSTEMGGLFTPMPSELPSNIRCLDGDARAIGYVGVRGQVAQADIYVNRRDVECTFYEASKMLPDSLVNNLGPAELLARGYVVQDFDSYSGTAYWTDRWGVDCTDFHWGASLAKPSFWKDKDQED